MKGALLGNMDIDLFVPQKEFDTVSSGKEVLECILKGQGGIDTERKAQLQFKDFHDLGDGIKVDFDFEKETYMITFNQHASDLIDDRGTFGTRYAGGDKITIYISERFDGMHW